MKKILLSTALVLAVSSGFAQEKLVNKAFSEAKAETPNFSVAQSEIKEALASPETKDNAKTWFVAGFIENKLFESERNKQLLGKQPDENQMYNALLECYKYYVKAAELDQMPNEKGKVKPKYLKDIKNTLKNDQSYFFYGGGYYYNEKNYQKAYDLFEAYVEIPKLSFFTPEEFAVDTNMNMVQFYAAVAASLIPNPQLAIKNYEGLKGKGYNENEVYQYLALEYQNLGDTAKYEKTLEEGAKVFPSDPYYVQTLINLYIGRGEYPKALSYLDDAIAQEPNNAQFYDVKGRLLENEKKTDEALALYEKAVQINPQYAEAYANIGRVYYNRAIEENDKADTKNYKEIFKTIVKPLFEKALPYYEKAHELKPEEKEYMVALRGIYYKLDMGDKYDQIEKQLSGN